MKFAFNDGGRAAAGYKGQAGDCVCRAIAIAAGIPYKNVYDSINLLRTKERRIRKSSARTGVYSNTARKYIESLGFKWTPTMGIGTGCKVHLREGELPLGRLIVVLSKHYVAVIDGVIYDLSDPSREGTRCIYGYYSL